MNKQQLKESILKNIIKSFNDDDGIDYLLNIEEGICHFALEKGLDPYIGNYKLSQIMMADEELYDAGLEELEGYQYDFINVFLEIATNSETLMQDFPLPGKYVPMNPLDDELVEVISYYEDMHTKIMHTFEERLTISADDEIKRIAMSTDGLVFFKIITKNAGFKSQKYMILAEDVEGIDDKYLLKKLNLLPNCNIERDSDSNVIFVDINYPQDVKLLYIHGFRSNSKNKVESLKSVFPYFTVDGFDLTYEVKSDMERLLQIINEPGPIIVCGTSLGGFFTLSALALVRNKDARFIPINPSFQPHVTLAKYIDLPQSRFDGGEDIVLSQNAFKEFLMYSAINKVSLDKERISRSHSILSTNDEILDLTEYAELIHDLKGRITYTNQGHRLEDISILSDVIEDMIMNFNN